jgi:hypothetical protein
MPVMTCKLRAWFLAVVAFLVMIAYLPGVMSVSIAGRWGVITLVGLPALLTWGVPRASLGSFLVLSLFGWVLLSFAWTTSSWDTLGSALHWAALFGLGLVASRLENRNWIWVAAALGVSVSLPFVLLQADGYALVWTLAPAGLPGGNAGLFLTTNVLAEVSTVAFVLMICQRRLLLAVAPAICAVLSGRAEVYLMLATVLLLSWQPTRKHFGFVLIGAMLLFVTLAAYNLVGPSMEMRMKIWGLTIAGSTFLGSGLGTFGTTFYPTHGFAHNELLQLIFELGIGVTFAVGLIAYALFNPSRHNFPDKLALAALLASGTVWGPLQDPATALLVSLLVGGLVGDRYRAEWTATVQRVHYTLSFARQQGFAPTKIRKTDMDYVMVAARSEYPLGGRPVASDVQPVR